MKLVRELQIGDWCDLEGDEYADPNYDEPYLEFAYIEVVGITQESEDCIRVDFQDYDSVGFPIDHELPVYGG